MLSISQADYIVPKFSMLSNSPVDWTFPRCSALYVTCTVDVFTIHCPKSWTVRTISTSVLIVSFQNVVPKVMGTWVQCFSWLHISKLCPSLAQIPWYEYTAYGRTSMTRLTKIWLYNFDSLKPHFYIVKLGFTGVYIIFFLFLLENKDCGYSLEPPRRGGYNEYTQSMFWAEIQKISVFIWKFSFLEVKFSIYLNRCVFVMYITGTMEICSRHR